MQPIPSLRSRIRHHKLSDPNAWSDRLIMWLAACVAGLCVVGFTYLSDWAFEVFTAIRHSNVWIPVVLMPTGAMLVVWLTRSFAPGSVGSGIPQVMAGMSSSIASGNVRHFISVWLSVAKTFLGSLALMVGFSAGREGPSVQIAAGVMLGFRRWFSKSSHITAQDLMLVGGAAGIAAAFNAPLAGIMFAIEELTRRFEQRSNGLLVSAIVLAGLVSISIQGNFTYFGRISVAELNAKLLLPAAVCVLLAGLLGGLFSRLLILSTNGTPDRFSRFRAAHPIWFAGCCGLGVAVLGLVSHGSAHGSGYEYTQGVLDGGEPLPVLFVGVKFLATWLTYWSGVPGGIFAPSLAVGAGLGNDVALLMNAHATPLIALGMVGFLAAATQAPLTSFIIVMEMIDGHGMVLSLMATALIASLISKLISPPLYHSLCELQLERLQKPQEPAEAGKKPPAPEQVSA